MGKITERISQPVLLLVFWHLVLFGIPSDIHQHLLQTTDASTIGK
jgi:hypothetical protein